MTAFNLGASTLTWIDADLQYLSASQNSLPKATNMRNGVLMVNAEMEDTNHDDVT